MSMAMEQSLTPPPADAPAIFDRWDGLASAGPVTRTEPRKRALAIGVTSAPLGRDVLEWTWADNMAPNYVNDLVLQIPAELPLNATVGAEESDDGPGPYRCAALFGNHVDGDQDGAVVGYRFGLEAKHLSALFHELGMGAGHSLVERGVTPVLVGVGVLDGVGRP
jgi:hypothetical protein